jgi:hypothetical protein
MLMLVDTIGSNRPFVTHLSHKLYLQEVVLNVALKSMSLGNKVFVLVSESKPTPEIVQLH